MVDKKTLMEQAMDVVYSDPELNLWWKIKRLFGNYFHPDGYVKKEEKENQ